MTTNTTPRPPFALPERTLEVSVGSDPGSAGAVGHIVFAGEELPSAAGITVDRAKALGFGTSVGQTLVLAGAEGPVTVLLGGGDRVAADTTVLRDLAAHFAHSVPRQSDLALVLPPDAAVSASDAASAVVEGAALSRYVYRIGEDADEATLASLRLVCDDAASAEAEAGAARGKVLVRVGKLARDLAGTPGSIFTAERMGELAVKLGPDAGLEVEVFDKAALLELGCGGLLGVNLGSVEPPVMVKMTYVPEGEATGHLGLVGKGLMYDSGGLAIKPGDEVHAAMKNDMSGAGAVISAMTALKELGCRAKVTAWLMCTDNMPSGSAMHLGDIIQIRGGKTVEVINTDAEGRLVMADALVLATEEPVDAIVDIATLTGAAMRALGIEIAAVMGNNAALLDQVKASAVRADEQVWELPLERRYRKELNSVIADLRNLGGANAGSITAGLFLAEFVGDTPWVHIDIAGTAMSPAVNRWINKGTTGFGARLLADFALNFKAPAQGVTR